MHVNSECTLAPKLSKSTKSIDSVQIINTQKTYMMADSKNSYKGYKELHGITTEGDYKYVKKHLSERGLILAHPSTLPHMHVPNTNDAYKEYLKKYELPIYAQLKLNRGVVKNHLLERGYILVDEK